jgi:hypothetical protein
MRKVSDKGFNEIYDVFFCLVAAKVDSSETHSFVVGFQVFGVTICAHENRHHARKRFLLLKCCQSISLAPFDIFLRPLTDRPH